MARGYSGAVRPQAQRALRLPAALRCSSSSASSTGGGCGASPTSTCSSCSASASPTSSSTGPTSASRCRSQYPVLVYLLARACGSGSAGRGEGLRPVWPAAWLVVAALFLMGVRVGLNVADSGRDRRRLRRASSAPTGSPTANRSTATSPTTSPGRHLRPGQLPRLRPLRGDLALVGRLGRPARRARRRDHLRPGHLRPAAPARHPDPARTRGPAPRRDPRLRLGRLPLHRLRPRVELQRHAGRGAARGDAVLARHAPWPAARRSRSRPGPSSPPRVAGPDAASPTGARAVRTPGAGAVRRGRLCRGHGRGRCSGRRSTPA